MSDALLEPARRDVEPATRAAEPLMGEIPLEGPGEEPTLDLEGIGGLFSPGRRALTSGLVMTITLVAFEALAVAQVMPQVAAELGDLHLYGWVFSAFLLASMLGIVVAGGLIDRGGLIRPMAAGLGLFSIGLVIGGLAPSMGVLVVGRALQGFGAGAIPPIAYVAIGRAMPDALRPKMFAVLSTAWVLPGVIGPALAGAVAQATSWRVVFLGLLPLIALAAAIILPALRTVPARPADDHVPEDPDGRNAFGRRLRFAVVAVVGAALLLAGLTSGDLIPGGPLLLAGLGLLVPAFQRLTPVGTLRALPGLPAAVLLRGLLTFTFFCADAYVPYALQHWRGLGLSVSGLALTGATLSWTVGAWVQARWIGVQGVRRFVRAGFTTVVVGIAGFALILSPEVPVAVGIVAWTLAGFGMGLSYSPLSLTTLREAPPGGEGAATSGLQLSDNLGTALGAGVGGALIAFGVGAGLEGWVGLAGAFAAGGAGGLVGIVLSGRLRG
jgi:MFS family permease